MGKPAITPENVANSEYIELSIVSRKKYLPICTRRLRQMCEAGIFQSAFKPGTGKWLVLKSEVLCHRMNGHRFPQH